MSMDTFTSEYRICVRVCVLSKHKLSLAIAYQLVSDLLRQLHFSLSVLFCVIHLFSFFVNAVDLENQFDRSQLGTRSTL